MIHELRRFARNNEARYKALGFHKHSTSFFRVENNIIHAFTFKPFRRNHTYDVDYGIFPLCSGSRIYIDSGGYSLSAYFPETDIYDVGWNCYVPDMKLEMLMAIDSYILTLFERCFDCKSSLNEILEVEKKIESNRKVYLKRKGFADYAVHWQERSLCDPRKYYMALKARDYDYAKQFLYYNISLCETRITRVGEECISNQLERGAVQFREKINYYNSHLKHICAKDFHFFDSLIETNERTAEIFVVGDRRPISLPFS